MDVTLRQAGPEDLPILSALEARAFSRPWPQEAMEAELSLPQAEVWIAWNGANAVGYIDFWLGAGELSILNVAVDPALQRQGIGRRLLGLAELRARDEGLEQIFLEVRVSNNAAIGLYRAGGFQQVGIRRGYYSDNGEDAIVLHRDLVAD